MRSSVIILFLFAGLFSCRFGERVKNPKTDPTNGIFSHTYKVKWAENNRNTAPLLLLLHGRGSDENDMMRMAKGLPFNYNVFALRAPLEHSNGKFTWYKMDMSKGVTYRDENDINNAMAMLMMSLDYFKSEYKLQPSKVVIGGFSQGAILSLNAGLKMPELCDGVLMLSGLMLDDLKTMSFKQKEYPMIFISHGEEDRVIPFRHAEECAAVLRQAGITHTFRNYEGMAHSINASNFKDVYDWLKAFSM